MDQSAASILLTCLGYANQAAKAERLARVPAEEWRMVAELAQQHGAAPLLYHHLKLLNIALPGAVAEELKQEYRQNALRNIRLYQELSKLLRRLQEKDIPVIALKGAYLAEAVYDAIALRTIGDVDLLVKKDNLLRVEQELLALGYQRGIDYNKYHFSYRLPRNGLSVEIHWTIFVSSYPFQFDPEELWSRAQPVTLAQTPAWALTPEDLLLHLCQHTAKHTYAMQIRMLCDIGEVVRRFGTELDWQEIGARARQWGIVRAVYLILRLAQELLDAAVPADWLASLRPDSFNESYLALDRQQIFAAGVDSSKVRSAYIARLWGLKGLAGKIGIIRDRLLLPRERMALLYPAPANSWRIYLYYPVRLKDSLVRHGATLWRLAHGDPNARSHAEHVNQIKALYDWLMSG